MTSPPARLAPVFIADPEPTEADRPPPLETPAPVLMGEAEIPEPPPSDVPPAPQSPGVRAMARLGARRSGGAARWTGLAFGALLSLALGVAAYDFAAGLLSRNPILGAIGAGLLIIVAVGAGIMAAREVAAYGRMRRVEALRLCFDAAWSSDNLDQARAASADLSAFYADRPELAWGRARLEDRKDDLFDVAAVTALAERELLAPLDAAARAEVVRTARLTALATAASPVALLDAALTLYLNLRMTRRVAAVYGGRAGWSGSVRLTRRIAAAMAAAGAISLGDDMLGPLMGGGLAGKLSRRFGEGVVNGALTARVGAAAIDACRPAPFKALRKPSTAAMAFDALRGADREKKPTERPADHM